MNKDPLDPSTWTVFSNEFATVHLSIDDLANGPRLVLLDPTSGRQIALDPLELQALAWTRHEQLSELLAPAFKESYLHRINAEDIDAPENSDLRFEED